MGPGKASVNKEVIPEVITLTKQAAESEATAMKQIEEILG